MQRIANPSTPVRFRPQPPYKNYMALEQIDIDCLIIGGGVAGIATARELSFLYKDIFVVEENNMIAQETSSRNSEVIHAGIYYKENSLKSKLCIRGKNLLYEYLEERNIGYNKCGKFIISTNDPETEKLNEIYDNAGKCGVDDLEFKKEIPHSDFLNYQQALFSPSTGIFDSHAYIESLKRDFESNGGNLLLNNKVISIELFNDKYEVLVKDLYRNEEFLVRTKRLINSAGLNAATLLNNYLGKEVFSLNLVKGEYYNYTGKEKLNNLIYPIPTKNSLGIHATIDLGNGIRFGPSAYEINKIDYSLDGSKKHGFVEAIRKYWPTIEPGKINPSYSGIRAIIKNTSDFVIDKQEIDENIFISILSYVSPGLTSSLALGSYVRSLIKQD